MRSLHLIIALLTALLFTGYASMSPVDNAWYPEVSGYALDVVESTSENTDAPFEALPCFISACMLCLLALVSVPPLPSPPSFRRSPVRFPELPQGPPLTR